MRCTAEGKTRRARMRSEARQPPLGRFLRARWLPVPQTPRGRRAGTGRAGRWGRTGAGAAPVVAPRARDTFLIAQTAGPAPCPGWSATGPGGRQVGSSRGFHATPNERPGPHDAVWILLTFGLNRRASPAVQRRGTANADTTGVPVRCAPAGRGLPRGRTRSGAACCQGRRPDLPAGDGRRGRAATCGRTGRRSTAARPGGGGRIFGANARRMAGRATGGGIRATLRSISRASAGCPAGRAS